MNQCYCSRSRFILSIIALLFFSLAAALDAAESGSSVVVIYNSNADVPESKQVAEYYAQRRQVPADQVFGFKLPVEEWMSRAEFIDQLQKPLLKELETRKFFTLADTTNSTSHKSPVATPRRVVDARIRYALLCYGVPTKILHDPNLVEEGMDKMRPELRRNEASVDSQLACLPLSEQGFMWTGPFPNRFYGTTNSRSMHPTNGILLVTRLDGPSASIARGLVDKALEAETNGLWGRAYFDALGITNGPDYKLGDDWIRGAAQVCRRLGFETELDEKPGYFPSDSKNSGTFPASYPMSHIAFYAGWYDWHVSGPFTRPTVEFMPGAFAYHLHSFSAKSIRTASEHWVGPLLAKGATITMGSVDEPYLMGTPDISAFLAQLIFSQFSFGEAAYASQNSLSWQNIAIGDPLYRPFGRRPEEQHADLERRQSKLIEWSHVRVVNLNQAMGTAPAELIGYLEQMPLTRRSAVLKEKLADLYWAQKKFFDALDLYDSTLKLDPSPQQKTRIMLKLAERRSYFGPDQAAFDIYQRFLKEFPDYPDLLSIYQKLLPLAQKLEKKDEVERCQREIKRLAPAPPASKS
jgi:uncharacterized protein (TIGR03790 family)